MWNRYGPNAHVPRRDDLDALPSQLPSSRIRATSTSGIVRLPQLQRLPCQQKAQGGDTSWELVGIRRLSLPSATAVRDALQWRQTVVFAASRQVLRQQKGWHCVGCCQFKSECSFGLHGLSPRSEVSAGISKTWTSVVACFCASNPPNIAKGFSGLTLNLPIDLPVACHVVSQTPRDQLQL